MDGSLSFCPITFVIALSVLRFANSDYLPLVSNASSHTLVVIYQLIPHMDVYMYFTIHTLRSSFQFEFRFSSHCKVSIIFVVSSFGILCPMLPVSLDCPFLLAASVFAHVYSACMLPDKRGVNVLF